MGQLNQNEVDLVINIEQMVSQNPILKLYKEQGTLNTNNFSVNLQKVIDLTNESYEGTESKNIQILFDQFDPKNLISL